MSRRERVEIVPTSEAGPGEKDTASAKQERSLPKNPKLLRTGRPRFTRKLDHRDLS